MTSVKELGETLRKRQAATEGGDATEGMPQSVIGSAYAIVLVVGGCLILALGAMLASVTVVAPDLAWMAESLERMGIHSGAVLAAGVSLLGLGLVCKALGQVQRGLLTAIQRSAGTAGLAENQEEIHENLGKVHFALRVLQESTKSLLEATHDGSFKREDSEHGDAVFHLAASLDQLGVRLEDRLDSQQSGIERRLGSLDGALEETRRRLNEWLESKPTPETSSEPEGQPKERQGKRRGRQRGAANGKGKRDSRELQASAAPADARREAVGEKRQEPRKNTDAQQRGDEGEREEFELLVTLEEQENSDGDAGRGSAASRTPLGVLDVLDDFGQGVAGEVEEAPASSAFLFDSQLAARLEQLAELDDEQAPPNDTQEKLAQLQSLLSDSKLRRVLDGLRDSNSTESA